MPTFHYQAWDAERQSVEGELSAESVQEAISQLEAKGLVLQSIGHATSEGTLGRTYRIRTDEASARIAIEQTVLRTHLAKVLAEGKAIVPALQAISDEIPAGRRRNELHRLIHILEQGDQAEAERAFAELPDYWIPLLSAAISSTDPGRVLQEFLRESQRGDELRRQWWLMLVYPLLISGLAGAVLIFLSLVVIPIFRDIFVDFNVQLPGLTLVSLKIAQWITRVWPYAVFAFVLLVGWLSVRSLRGRMRPVGDSSLLGAFFGPSTAIARLSQFIADFLEAGLSIPDTLRIVGLLVSEHNLRRSVWRLADEMQIDARIAKRLEPPPRMASVYYALRSEMPTQSRIRLLREIAQVHSERAQFRLSWTRGMVEPAAILAIGAIVGLIVISLFLPLFQLIRGLSM